MKNKIITVFLLVQLFIPKLKAQNGKDIAIAAGAGIVTGLLIANSVENVKEAMERHMLEWVLENKHFNDKIQFELRLIKWEANKKEELNSISVVAFEYIEKGKEPVILLNACSRGWVNEYGVNFTNVRIYEINKEYWGKIMESYLSLSINGLSNELIDINNIRTNDSKFNVVNQSLKNLSNIDKSYIEFKIPNITDASLNRTYVELVKLQNNKTHLIKDLDQQFLVDFDASNMNLYLKNVKGLITFKSDFIVDITKILFK